MEQDNLIGLTAEIVSAYVSTNAIASDNLTGLINQVHAALHRTTASVEEPEEETLIPAVAVKKSVTPDYIVCLEDGKKFKSLKRHIRAQYDLTPAEYRTKWGLTSDYPMVAPNYSIARSDLAKSMGLGRKIAAPAKKAGIRKRAVA